MDTIDGLYIFGDRQSVPVGAVGGCRDKLCKSGTWSEQGLL